MLKSSSVARLTGSKNAFIHQFGAKCDEVGVVHAENRDGGTPGSGAATQDRPIPIKMPLPAPPTRVKQSGQQARPGRAGDRTNPACGSNRNARRRGAVARPATRASFTWRLFSVRLPFAAQRSPRLRLQDPECLTDADETVEFFLLLGSQFPVTVLCRQVVHAAPVGLGKLKTQKVAGCLARQTRLIRIDHAT